MMRSLFGKTAVDTGMASSMGDGAPSTSVVGLDAAGRSFWTEADGRGTSWSDKICSLDVFLLFAIIGWTELSVFEEGPSGSASGAWFSVASSGSGEGCAALRATVGISAKGGKRWVVLVSVALASKSMVAGG